MTLTEVDVDVNVDVDVDDVVVDVVVDVYVDYRSCYDRNSGVFMKRFLDDGAP